VIAMSFILLFDIPSELQTLKRQIDRQLTRVGAELVQKSVWKLENLNLLIDIASWIKRAGSDARILEEKFLF